MFALKCGTNIAQIQKDQLMNNVSDRAVVETTQIGKNVEIMPFCFIAKNVVIGNNVKIHCGVVLEDGVQIGNNVEIFSNSCIGKEPKSPGSLSRKLEFKKVTNIGDNCLIGPGAVIYCDVKIANNCLIGDNASIREQVEIGEYSVIGRSATVNYNTTIGKRTKIMDLAVITGNCTIGNDVFISCLVATTNDKKIGQDAFNADSMRGPIIKDHVSIGAGANILHNAILEEGCVIAAGSVVTKDVPEKVLVMGVPAKIIREI